MKKRGLIALVVLVVIVIAAGGVFAWRGDELMGLARNKSVKTAKLPWYCAPNGVTKDSWNSGGEGKSESSSTRYISPDTFKKIHDLGPGGVGSWVASQYFGGSVAPDTSNGENFGSVEIPEFNVDEDDDKGDEQITVTCACPAYSWGDGRITIGIDKDAYYSEFGGDNEKVCEEYAPDDYCANPIDITCTCNKEQKTQTLSSWEFENWYKNSSEKFCADSYTEFECNPRWWCPTGSDDDYGKISDACNQIIDSKKKSCALDTCPGLDFEDPPSIDPKVETFCKVYFGNYWNEYYTNVCDSITAESCPSMDDCDKYKSWFDAGVGTSEMAGLLKEEGKSQEEIDAFLNVCGFFF